MSNPYDLITAEACNCSVKDVRSARAKRSMGTALSDAEKEMVDHRSRMRSCLFSVLYGRTLPEDLSDRDLEETRRVLQVWRDAELPTSYGCYEGLILEDIMEKYGVEEITPEGKTAEEEGSCPDCNAKLEEGTNVKKCPKCGVAPFQEQEDG